MKALDVVRLGFEAGYSHGAPHTLYVGHRVKWAQEQRNAKALMFCFAHALSYAKNMYGVSENIVDSVKFVCKGVMCMLMNFAAIRSNCASSRFAFESSDVPRMAPQVQFILSQAEPQTLAKPVVVNCVQAHTHCSTFDFMCFQLNTTDFTSSEGVKNMVWTDNNNVLYVPRIPYKIMLRNTTYNDYDPEVFKKFVAMHLTGFDTQTTWSDGAKSGIDSSWNLFGKFSH